MFTQRPEDDEGAWAALPGEPLTTDAADTLPASGIDPFAMDLVSTTVESIVFPVAPPAPEASDFSDAAPKDPTGD